MINRIAKLKNIGIFENFNADLNLDDFKKFNLFYGWNGSGKTTLSRFLSTLESGSCLSKFDEGEYEIQFDNTKRNHKSLSPLPNKIYTFNQEFINDNIDWSNNGAKSIVVISESKIEERKRYLALKEKEIPKQNNIYQKAKATFDASNKEIDIFLTSEAKSIKQSFQVIDTGDSYFVNYDKRKLKTFIQSNRERFLSETAVLDAAELAILHKKVKPIEKSLIEDSYTIIKEDQIIQAKSKIDKLLQVSLIDTSIKRLNENADINEWVKFGVEIHYAHGSTKCEYCGEEISAERKNELNMHFNEVYLETITNINSAIEWLLNLVPIISHHDKGLFFEELIDRYIALKEDLEKEYNELKKGMEEWELNLKRKAANPFENNFSSQIGLEKKVSTFNNAINKLKAIIQEHNTKVNSFADQLKIAKSQLELHYVADSVIQKDYFKVLDRISVENLIQIKEYEKLEILNREFIELEAVLSDAALAADEFNANLHKFLGRREITLNYDSKEKGFKIYRGEEMKMAKNLSEGEKTAIAFTYYLAKLKENGNEIKNSIVVIDDPISSFDSNHLYHSFACLRDVCEDAKQAFILTHNFQYFKLVRDWLSRKNVKKDREKQISRFYTIESTTSSVRSSSIKNCHDSLLKFGSEYHFIYLKLKKYRTSPTLDLEASCLVANMSRKVLETFLSFKHPKGRSNFKELLEAGHDDRILTDKVYRFINKYSHVDGYDIDTSSIDNLLGEGVNIVNDVFIILAQDEKHYNEMELLDIA